ncbi:MATE family efflux transporter [Sphingomonas parva]|uniref:MATE family efflux transporter n=1 Tax=Sphingomonas parva TaxID=2555898 RepID=A0A4Y8ZQB9_9SPHN|nr:MATE family efflux transporter [Sphingomonas parva]TFI58154.1 MATE family efflux transporter [Sphingomonas parva]
MQQRGTIARPPWREEVRATVALAWPLILTNIAQALINATDVVLLGWAGPRTLAAGTLGVNIYYAFLIFGMGLVTAAAPMISRELGARRHSVRDVRRTVRQAMWAAIAIALPVWIILWNSGAILVAIGQDPVLAENAQRFVRALQWGLLPYLFYLVLRSFVSALERPIWSLIVGLAAVLFNGLANYALIFGKFGLPAFGLLGAGIGSAAANFLMFAGMALVVSVHPKFRRYRLFGRFWRPDRERFAQVWRLGLPIAVTLGLEITVFNAAVFLMGLIGAEAIAAHAIAIQIAALTFMVPMGLAQAVTVRVGLAYGRRDRAGIALAGWTAFGLGVGFMACTALVMLAMPERLVGFFLHESDPANARVIPLAVSFLFVAAIFQIVDGAQVVGAGMLRGLNDTKVPMIYAALGYWVIGISVSLALAFGLGWGGVGIWTGLATGLASVAVLMIGRWSRRERLGLVDC